MGLWGKPALSRRSEEGLIKEIRWRKLRVRELGEERVLEARVEKCPGREHWWWVQWLGHNVSRRVWGQGVETSATFSIKKLTCDFHV